ncbi:MAG: FkbM family methyltransferase, partial [Chitinivibrionales bacterium]|nr:FkbM family methyltransferase [Chitinivibrionales bacterium]
MEIKTRLSLSSTTQNCTPSQKPPTEPLIRYNLEGTELLLPVSHKLPLFRRQFPFYSANVGRLAAGVFEKYPDMKFIDIGANVGDTVAFLRATAHFPILCIEGDEYFFTILALNVERSSLTDVHVEHAFVGMETTTIQGRLQTKDGTGHLVSDGTGTETVNIRTLADIVKEKTLFSSPRMIKIDTDGYDCQILFGSL